MKIKKVSETKALKYLKSYEIQYLDKKEHLKTWELVSRGSLDRLESEIHHGEIISDGTMIFATDEARRKVVLLKEFRVSAGHDVYMLPAGLSDGEEDVETTSVREFWEETGLTFHYEMSSKARYASVGITNERIQIAFGTYSGEVDLSHQSDEEEAEVIFVDREMAKHLLQNEDVCVRSALLLEDFFQLNAFFHQV